MPIRHIHCLSTHHSTCSPSRTSSSTSVASRGKHAATVGRGLVTVSAKLVLGNSAVRNSSHDPVTNPGVIWASLDVFPSGIFEDVLVRAVENIHRHIVNRSVAAEARTLDLKLLQLRLCSGPRAGTGLAGLATSTSLTTATAKAALVHPERGQRRQRLGRRRPELLGSGNF